MNIFNEAENNKEINFVETYLIEEVTELLHDNEKLTEYQELTKRLGIVKNLSVDGKSPIPFPPMGKIEREVFQTLCGTKTKLKEFDKTPIPLEILKLIDMSISEDYFQHVEIWHDYETPDPVAVGITGYWYGYNANGKENDKNGNRIQFDAEEACRKVVGEGPNVWFSETQRYIIGRWADVKATFKELQQRARERWIRQESVTYKKQKSEAEQRLKDIEVNATDKFGV